MPIDYGQPLDPSELSYRRDAGGNTPQLGGQYGLASTVAGAYGKQADEMAGHRIGTEFSDQERQLLADSTASQKDALDYQRRVALGQVQSPAERQALAGVGQAQAAQSSLAASVHGGPAMSAAARNAANQQTSIATGAQNGIAAMRANEMAAGRNQYASLAGQGRNTDQELWELGQQRELANAQLNDQGVLASQSMSNEILGSQLGADSSAYNTRTGADLSSSAAVDAANRQADHQREAQLESAAASAATIAVMAAPNVATVTGPGSSQGGAKNGSAGGASTSTPRATSNPYAPTAAPSDSRTMMTSDINAKTSITPQGQQSMPTPPNTYGAPQGGLAQTLAPQQPAQTPILATPTFSDIRAKSGVQPAGMAPAMSMGGMQTEKRKMPGFGVPQNAMAMPQPMGGMQPQLGHAPTFTPPQNAMAPAQPMPAMGAQMGRAPNLGQPTTGAMAPAMPPPPRPPMQQQAMPSSVPQNAMTMSDADLKYGVSEGTKDSGTHRDPSVNPVIFSDERVKAAAFRAGQDAAHERMARTLTGGAVRGDDADAIARGEIAPPSNPHAIAMAERASDLDRLGSGNAGTSADRNAAIDAEIARIAPSMADRRVADLAAKIRATSGRSPAPAESRMPPMQYVESSDLDPYGKRHNDFYRSPTKTPIDQQSRAALIRDSLASQDDGPSTLFSDPRLKTNTNPPYMHADLPTYSTGAYWPSEMTQSRMHERVGGRIMSDATLKYEPEHGLSSAYASRAGRPNSAMGTGDATTNLTPQNPSDAHLMPAPKRSLSYVMSDKDLKTVDAAPVYKETYGSDRAKLKNEGHHTDPEKSHRVYPRSLDSVMSDEDVKVKRPGGTTEADEFLDTAKPYSYKYIDPSYEPTDQPTGERYLGVMAQNIERGPTGKTIVKDTPRGKALEGGALMSALAAGEGRLHERVTALEAAAGKNKKGK